MTTHAFGNGQMGRPLCGADVPYVISQPVDCPDCLRELAHDPYDRALDTARELVTLRLLDDEADDLSLDAAIASSARAAYADRVALIEVLVEGVAATWDSAEDFSSHVVAALADGDTE